jgi:DNA-binding phage protein
MKFKKTRDDNHYKKFILEPILEAAYKFGPRYKLASETELSESNMAGLLSNTHRMNIDTCLKLCDVLNLKLVVIKPEKDKQ